MVGCMDLTLLCFQDYYDIVKNPMDMSLLRNKLVSGVYKDPWEYVNDVWLMFDNAWLYNKKQSKVYKDCMKVNPLSYHSVFLNFHLVHINNVSSAIEFQLVKVFEREIDDVMQRLGYCCGRKYVYQPQKLCCYGKDLCTIPRNAIYYHHHNRYGGGDIQCCVLQSVILLEANEPRKIIKKRNLLIL